MVKIRKLIDALKKCNQNEEVLLSSDEEFNCLRQGIKIFHDNTTNTYIIYGLDGSELKDIIVKRN